MNIDQTQALLSLTLGFAALVGVVGAWLRWIRPRWNERRADRVAMRDSIVGREAIRDSITGREIAPELPGIGVRMDNQERQLVETGQQVGVIAEAVSKLADAFGRIENHEERIQRLEAASVERVVTKAESAAAWRAVEAVAQQSAAEPIPPEDQTSGD